MTVFDEFRASLGDNPVTALHDGVIGKDAVLEGPFGPKRMIYADYVASGRALRQVEEFVMTRVLPWYANSHTEASHCGRTMTRMRRAARAEILRCVQGDADHAVIFTGSGATAGINRLVHLLGVGPGSRVLIGPYEHHSNILPWRESGAEVIEIPEAPSGGPDLDRLICELEAGPAVVALSAASNVTGILTDVARVTGIVKGAGGTMVWDYAGGAPYLPIDMGLGMDAVVASPHKFAGGPGASGVMILRRDAVSTLRPSLPGGGTVRFVSAEGHDYSDAVEVREEAGTPNVVGDIRAALAFAVKDAVGQARIDARNAEWLAYGLEVLGTHPRVELLGNTDCPRLPILSFRIRDGQGGYIHQQLVTRMLSDLYGVQARGGCACAGPYVLRLLGIDSAGAAQLRAAILSGEEIRKPGFVRLNLSYLADRAEIGAILSAITGLADSASGYVSHYDCDPTRAIFHPIAAE